MSTTSQKQLKSPKNKKMISEEMSKIHVLENNMEHISKALIELKIEMREGFEKIDKKFDKVDDRFDKIDDRFDKVDDRFKKVDDKIDSNFKWIIGTMITLHAVTLGAIPVIVKLMN